MKQKMLKFLKKYDACSKGLEWADKNAESLEHGWRNPETPPKFLIWLACKTPIITDLEKHRFGLWCARQVQHLMTDPRSIKALDVKERWLNGESAAWAAAESARSATEAATEAATARAAASAARAASAWEAAAAWEAAREARAAAREAAREAGASAARAASAREAAWEAREAGAAAVAAWEAQVAWIRANTKPNFEVE